MLANVALFVFGTRRRVSELPEKSGRFEQVHRVSFDHESNLVKTPFEPSLRRGGCCLCGGGEIGIGGMI
jgi:hypothetical protein